MKFFLNATLVTLSAVLLLSGVTASATTVTASLNGIDCGLGSTGLCSARAGAKTVTFDGTGVLGSAGSYTYDIATFSGTGSGSPFVQGSLSGQFARPVDDDTVYLSVGSPNRPGKVTIDFAKDINYYGFYMGSPDTYNLIKFYQDHNLVGSFAGNSLFRTADGNQKAGAFVNFEITEGSVDQIVLSSTSPAFETDNHAFVATPEPASFALAGLGLTAVFFSRLKFRRQ